MISLFSGGKMFKIKKAGTIILFLLLFLQILPAAISYSPNNPKAGQNINFSTTRICTGVIPIQPKWYFGDSGGGFSIVPSGNNVSHIYTKPGTYMINVKCGNTIIDRLMITIAPNQTVNRKVVFSPANPSPGTAVQFQAKDFFSNCIRWDFGDGYPPENGGQNKSHIFNKSGIFYVKVYKSCGDDPNPVTVTISVKDNRKVTVTPKQSNIGSIVKFLASNFISNCIKWDFGDGSVLTGNKNQNHVYKKRGSFTVKAYDYCGDDKHPLSVTVNINDNRKLYAQPQTQDLGLRIKFVAKNFVSNCIKWDFGDGIIQNGGKRIDHIYDKKGAFTVKAFDNCGDNKSPIRVKVNIRDNRKITYPSFNFKAGSSVPFKAENFISECIKWDFGDGSIVPNGSKSQSHTFKTFGTFMVKAYDDCGKNFLPKMVSISIKPSIEKKTIKKIISFLPRNPKVGEKVNFLTFNFSSDCLKWSFGDNTRIIRGGKVISHTFSKAGFFKVKVYDNCNLFLDPAEVTIPVKNNIKIKVMTPRKKAPALPECPKELKVDEDHISLLCPESIYTQSNVVKEYIFAAKLDDMTFFEWKEINPGASDFFELRIFDKFGKKLILKKHIQKMNYLYAVTPDFIKEIHFEMESLFKKIRTRGKNRFKTKNSMNIKKDLSTMPDDFPDDTDLSWEVAGFKKILCKSNNKAKFKDIEIGVSEKWPLRLTDAYTGMNCPGGAMKKVNLRTDDIDRETLKTGETDPNIYINHRISLKGNFNFKDSPFSSHPEIIEKENQGYANEVARVNFNNIFVDWGDGSPSVPLSAIPDDTIDAYSSGMHSNWSGDKNLELTDNFIHRYQRSGKYTVRVFMLSENDIQQPIENFNELLGESITPASRQKDAYTLINYNSNNKFGFSTPGIEIDNGMNGVKDRAYMLFCEDIVVRDRMDMCADGPLNLVSIEITGFPGHDLKGGAYIGDAVNGINSDTDISGTMNNSKKTIPNGKNKKRSSKTFTSTKKRDNLTKTSNSNYLSQKVDARAATCDEMLQAKAELKFFGRVGDVLVIWKVDGIKIYSEIVRGLSSSYRKNLSKDDITDCNNALKASKTLYSPSLPVRNIGIHTVSVSATVIPETTSPYIGKILENTIITLPNKKTPDTGILYLKEFLKKNNIKKGQKIGFLNPQPSKKFQAASYTNSLSGSFSSGSYDFNLPPFRVVSKLNKYSVSQTRSGKICLAVFQTSKGNFKITDISNSLKKSGNFYSGTGILKLPMAANSHSIRYYAIPISIHKWTIDGATGLVKSGKISTTPGIEVLTPATDTTILRLKGRTSQTLSATLSLTLRDKSLLIPASGNSGEKSPKWKISSVLSGSDNPSTCEGDWIAKGKKLPETLLSWTAFRLSSDDITIDFSRSEGKGKGICGGSNPSWVGIDLGTARIIPYTFNLVSNSPFKLESDKFTITDDGICGSVSSAHFFSTMDKGSLKFDTVKLYVKNGNYDIEYKGLDIFVPWIDAHLKGNAPLTLTSEGYGISFSGVKSPDIQKNYENINMRARNLAFISEKNIGWIVRSDTEFNFSSENKMFANFTLNYFLFGFNGKAYFKEGETVKSLSLSGESSIGDSGITHNGVDITAPTDSGYRLKFNFHTKLHLTESQLIHDPDVQIDYSILNNENSYFSKGPDILPFSVNLSYPLGNPLMNSTLNPEYSPAGSSLSYNLFKPENKTHSMLTVPGGGGTGQSQQSTRFYGRVNMSMFGGPPVDAQFLLGYKGSGSFFLIRADIPLSSQGVTFVPPYLTLFRISGGLGYNFPVNAYKNASIEDAEPDMQGKTIFMAGMRVGHPTKFPFMLDGTLSITTGGEARMDFDSWILSNDHSGDGQLQGFFQYGGGNFDGKMWGGFNFMNGLISFDLGNSESNAAFDIHFGNGKWHLYAGNKNGQRIKAHFLILNADSYMMLGSDEGLLLGGSEHILLDKSIGVLSGYVKGWMEIGLQVKPQPKIIGNFGTEIKAGACVDLSAFKGCLSQGITAQIHVSAPPLDIRANATIDLPWPAGSVSFKVHL